MVSEITQTWHGCLPWACPLLAEVGVISCMSKNRPCSTKGVRVRHKGPYESMFFRHRQMTPNFFSLTYMTNSRHHAKLFEFYINFAFSRVFSVKKADKWMTVSQVAYGVRNHSYLTCLPSAWPPVLQKLESFEGCPKIDLVQRRMFGQDNRLRLRACCFSTSLKSPQFFFMAFYDQLRHYAKLFRFSMIFPFSGVFSVKKGR
jgi:hypothetical protein